MTIALAQLVDQLQGDVPASNGVPTAAQYTQAIKDAVGDLGRRVPLTKVATLSIVSGTAGYPLPADFVKLIRLLALNGADGLLITDAGLVPVSRRVSERSTIAGTTITFHPTPAYTMERELWYAATYVLNEDNAYGDLTEDRAQTALLKARSLTLGLQASKAAPLSIRLKSGDDDVDRTRVAEALRATAAAWQDQYEAAIKRLIGAVGMRG